MVGSSRQPTGAEGRERVGEEGRRRRSQRRFYTPGHSPTQGVLPSAVTRERTRAHWRSQGRSLRSLGASALHDEWPNRGDHQTFPVRWPGSHKADETGCNIPRVGLGNSVGVAGHKGYGADELSRPSRLAGRRGENVGEGEGGGGAVDDSLTPRDLRGWSVSARQAVD